MPRLGVRIEEAERAIRAWRATLILVYDSRRHPVDYIQRLLEALAPAFEPSVPLLGVDVSGESLEDIRVRFDVKSVGDLPALLFYLNGQRVWSQYGLFYDLKYDKLAVRVGVRRALEVWGLRPRDLGLNLLELLS